MTHKAILIDPLNRTVTEVDQADGLQQLYERLSVEGFRRCNDINAVMLPGRNAMYVDGEGLLIGNLPMFSFLGGPAKFAGRGLIVGTNDEGDDVAHNLPVDKVRESVVWLDLLTTGDLAPGGWEEGGDHTILGVIKADAVYKVGEPVLKDRDE